MLTVHQLASVVAADLSPESLEHDVRRARRFPYHGQIRISLDASNKAESEDVSVVDLSARGLRFVYPTRFARGATFVARLPRYGGEELVILCTVAHCQIRPNGMFTVGVEFTCVLTQSTETESSDAAQDRIRHAILARSRD
jgi:PilZ domain-containing protein